MNITAREIYHNLVKLSSCAFVVLGLRNFGIIYGGDLSRMPSYDPWRIVLPKLKNRNVAKTQQ